MFFLPLPLQNTIEALILMIWEWLVNITTYGQLIFPIMLTDPFQEMLGKDLSLYLFY